MGTALDPATRVNGNTCIADSVPMLMRSGVSACVNSNGQVILQTGPNAGTASGDQTGIPSNPAPNSCGSWWWTPGCIWQSILKLLGAFFLWIGGTVLQMAGWIFNNLVTHVIVQFGSTIKSLNVAEGLHNAWGVLRDMSNIVIIGMFTFIAISIIIGNHTFGEKRLIAKVLVVAVLINFSLLFAKIIIDSSNFIAYQIYKAMGSEGSANIAGKFLSAAGITSTFGRGFTENFRGGEQAVRASGGNLAQEQTNYIAASQGFFHGLVGGATLLFAAGVLLYGCYLIVARAVLLIFLMLVSALAFASFLIPKYAEAYWSKWWKTLIDASIFGPLLMILLYASLVVISKTPQAGQPGADGWLSVLSLLFSIGMLYVSFKVANSFAGKIAGFSTASTLTMAPVVGVSRLVGLAGRSAGGRMANTRFGKWGQNLTDKMEKDKNYRPTMREMAGLKAFNWARKGTFDVTKTGAGKYAAKLTHAPGFGEDWGKGGYVGVKKRQTEHAVHVAEELGENAAAAAKRKSGEAADRIREQISKQIAELTKETSGLRHDIREGTAQTIERDTQADEKERQLISSEMQKLAKTGGVQRDGYGAIRPTEAQNRNASAERARSAMKGEAAKIAQAASKASHDAVDETVQSMNLESLQNALAHLNEGNINKLPKGLRESIEHAAHAGHAGHKAIAEYVASWTPGSLLPGRLKDTSVAEGLDKAFKDHSEQESLNKLIKGLSKNFKPPAAAPAAHADSHAEDANHGNHADHNAAPGHDDHGHKPH